MRVAAIFAIVCGIASVVFAGTNTPAGNWPGFRGPTGLGIVDAQSLPLTWSESKNVKWKLEVPGKAWSSPVVWGDQIWLTNADEGGTRLEAWCVNKNTGKLIKKLRLYTNVAPQYCHPFNSYASPSPAIEEGRVYVTFGSPYTACIDTKTLEVIWERTDFKCNHFRGAGSSPVIYGDLLLMHFDGSDYQYVAALNKHTGETVWRTDRSVDYNDLDPKTGKPDREGDWRKAFSTPVVHDFGDGPVFISLGSKAAYGYDPANGKEIWRVEWDKAHSGSSRPVIGSGLIFFCTGAGGELLAVRPGGRGVISDSHVAYTVSRGAPFKPSPLHVDGLVFMVDDKGIATCVEAKTGDVIWQERIAGKDRPASTFSASPIYADGRIYMFDEEGRATIIAASREFKVLAANDLDGGFMASPAVTDNALILRTKTHLYRIEE